MLKAKFDGSFENTPATYIWARLVRMKSTRSGAKQKEEAGHLIGGYNTLIQAMAKRIRETGWKNPLEYPHHKNSNRGKYSNWYSCGWRNS